MVSANSQPKSYDYVFKWFCVKIKLMILFEERINISLKANNIRLARYLIRFLSNKNKPWARILLKVHANPKNNILSNKLIKESRFRNNILSHGITRLQKRIIN